MRTFAITGIETASWMAWIMLGSDMRATPPSRRMSAGTRSSAMTETAPAASAILAWSGVTTSMITPPLSISASPVLTRRVAVSFTKPTLAAAAAQPPSIIARLCALCGGDKEDDRGERREAAERGAGGRLAALAVGAGACATLSREHQRRDAEHDRQPC